MTAALNLAGVPRSIRWRIQLALLDNPNEADATTTATALDSILDWNKEKIAQQQARFQQLIEKYVEEEEGEEEKAADPEAPPSPAEVDPLTAMVMEKEAQETRRAELYLKYRKERARRKRGLTTEIGSHGGDQSDGIDRASLGIIEKDLKRLPHPSGRPITPTNLTTEQEARITSLREILYIYAQEHPTMGYRQGMHEIASYLLFVLELEQPRYPEHGLFQNILAICFYLLEEILDQLQLAYDASGEHSLQRMSHSILSKIHQNDTVLYHHLTSSPNIPPPPIYCTRWVRLLFSREVVGYENVFRLWDVFMEYNLMRALEVTAASRILLLRDALMNHETNSLDLLMNVPPLSDISPLTDTLQQLMKQKDSEDPIQLPPSQILPSPQTPSFDRSFAAATPLNHPLNHSPGQTLESPNNDTMTNFSFSKMRSTLGQKGESLRKKIITTTNEWKQAARESSGSSLHEPVGGASPLGGGPMSRHVSDPGGFGFADPLLHPQGAMAVPPSPRQHQHECWSQMLKDRIWTVQEYLMAIEAKENGHRVPRQVWEALADMDKMQHELLNYSRNMK